MANSDSSRRVRSHAGDCAGKVPGIVKAEEVGHVPGIAEVIPLSRQSNPNWWLNPNCWYPFWSSNALWIEAIATGRSRGLLRLSASSPFDTVDDNPSAPGPELEHPMYQIDHGGNVPDIVDAEEAGEVPGRGWAGSRDFCGYAPCLVLRNSRWQQPVNARPGA